MANTKIKRLVSDCLRACAEAGTSGLNEDRAAARELCSDASAILARNPMTAYSDNVKYKIRRCASSATLSGARRAVSRRPSRPSRPSIARR